MYKSKRQVNRKSFDWYGLSQRFSIRKYHFGAASVLLGTALILGSPQATAKADDGVSANTAQTSTGQGVDEGTNSATDGLKNVTLPTASTTEAAVLEKPTLSDEEIAKLAATSETPAITSTSETAKEVKAESKPATSDAVVKTNTEEKAKTDKLTEKETKAEDKAEKKVDKQAETASQKTILTQLTSEAEVLNTTAANYAEKKVEDKASKDAIASAVATAKTEIAASKKALEAGEITKAELDAQLQRISSAIEAVYAEMKRGGHIGKVEAMLADVSSTINLPERTIVKRVNDLTDTEVEEIIRQIRIANPNLTKNDIITVDRGASTSAASGGATITFANGDTARLGAGDILTGIGGAKNADTLRQAINWFEFSSATIVYPDGTQAGPARYLDNPINMQVDSPDGTGKMTGRLTMVRDVIYTDGSKGLTTDERFKNLGVAEYSTHKYYTGGYQNNNEVYEVLKEGMVLKVPTRVEGYQLTLRVDKLGPKPVATDPNNTATRGKNAKGASEGVNKYKPVKMIMTTQDTTYSYLKQAGMDITVPDRDSSGNPIAGTSRPALAAITPNWDGANAGVTFSASATYNGVPVPVNLVASDGEEGGRGEFLQFVTNGSNWEELMALNLNKNGGYVYGTNKLDLNGYLKLNENGYNIDEWVTNPQAVDEKGNLRFADSSKTQRIMDVYGTKEFGPAWTAMRQGNALPIGFSQNVSQFSMYMHSTGAQAGTIGFITFDGGDAPESYGKAQHVIGNINKTLSDGRQVTASQPFLGDQPGDPDFRSTSDEHDKTGAWVLDDLVNTAKHRQVDVKTGNEISNESGDTGTYAIVNGNPVIRKTDGSTVAIKTGEIVTVKNPDDTFPIRGIFDTASQSVGVGSLPDEGRGQLLDSAVATDYKLRQATDNEYVLDGVRANLGQNNDVAYVRGWVDFNGNGKFDDGESSEVIELRQNKTISLKFKNIPQLLNTSIDSVGVRLRIALDKEEILKPTGLASSGEVEDFLTHVIHPPRGTRTKTKNYQGEKQSLEMTTSDLFTATGKTDRSKYQNWNQIDQTIPPKIVVTESVVAKEVPTGDADVNVTDPSGTTVYRGTVVKVYDKRNNELGTAVKVTNPLNGTTEYLLSNYTEYDTAGNKVGVYSLNKENNGLNKADSNGIYKTKIEFTPELGYVGTAKGIAIRAWDENRVSTGWNANDKTIEESKRNITLADKDKILANVNEDVNGRESMDTTYVPTVVDIKPVGKDETTTDVQGKEQSATPKIPDHGTVESITDSSVDESKISKEHVLIDKTKPITFAHEKVIPGKVYTEDTKVTEETVLTYEDGGTETFKPADKIPAGTEIAKNSPVTITGEGNVTVSGVRIANEGTTNSPNKVPAGSVLEGAQPTAPQPIKVLRNGVEVTVNTGEKLKVGDQLVDPLPITSGAQITTWKVTLQKGDVIPQSYSTLKPTLAEATGVDKITGTKGATLTYDGNKYVYNNDTIPQGTKTVGTTVDLSTLTLPNATHVDPATGVVTTVPRRYTTISDNKIVIENEGTYTIVPKTSTNEKGQTIYEDAKVVFTPDPKFVGVGTGVTLKQPDLDYNTRVDGDKVTSRYGTDYGYAKYTPVVTPDLTATIARKIHYVYEGDKSTPATAKKPILTIDDKPVVNEQTLTYNRDYIIMEKDGVTEKDIKVANVVTLNAPIKIKRFVKENNQTVEKEITTNTLQPGDEVKAGTQLSAGTVIIGAWKPINDENAKFTPIISPVLKGYTAEVQLPSTEYTKKEENGVQTHVRNANSTPAGIYTPSAPGGNVDTVNVGAYEPLVSVVRADDKDDFDVYVYYKADKQKANVVYIDLDEKGDKRVLETQSGTKVSELPTGTTQDPKTTYGVEKLSGESDSTIPYDTADTIKKYTDKGYELASDDYKNGENGRALADGRKFDEDSSVDQTFYVYLRHKKEQLSTNDKRTVTRHIEYKYADTDDVPADKKGQPVEESLAKTVTEVLTFERTRTLDMATTAKLFENEYNAYKAVLANNAVGSDAEVDARATLFEFVQGEVNKPTATDEVKAIISYGEWQAKPGTGKNIELSAAEKTIKDSKFNDVVSPTVPGYLPDNAKVEATADVNPESDPDDYTVTVTYSPGDQKAIVNFVEVDRTNTDQVITPGLAEPVTLTGKSGAAFPTTANDSVQAKIAELVKKGYELVDNGNGFVATDSFDTNSAVDQTYTVKLRAKEAPVVPTNSVTPQPGQPVDPGNPDGPKWPESVKDLKNKDVVKRTIKYVYEDGTPVIDPATGAQKVVEQTAEFTREANVNLVTGAITYGDWTPAKELVAVTSPTATDIPAVANHIVSTSTVPAVTVAAEADDITETVVYRQTKPITVQPNDPTPTKDQPIDPNNPNNPDGPKWTEELLKKLEDARKEEVNRTITYKYSDVASELKADDAAKAGQNAANEVTNKVEFKRPVTIDPKTLEFTYGDWVATNNDTILEGNATVPVVPGYVATGDVEKSKTDVTDVKATDKDITDKVVYKALGKFVPVVPEGFTPPTIENPQYPNNNEDPSKPGDPTTTTTIPYVPGTTPVGPDGQPLKPKVEGDPKQGYVPPAPTTPTGDTTITYVKDGTQIAVTKFVDTTGKGLAPSVVDTGDTGKAFTKDADVTAAINKILARGYEKVANVNANEKDYPSTDAEKVFDADAKTNQEFTVTFKPKELPTDPTKPVDPNNNPVDPTDPASPNKPRDPETTVTPKPTDPVPNDPKGRTYGDLGLVEQVTRTIRYVYEDGSPVEAEKLESVKAQQSTTLTFTRKAKINAVTGEVTYLQADGITEVTADNPGWTATNGSEFVTVKSPTIENYTAVVTGVTPTTDTVPAKTVTATDKDFEEVVVYKKVKPVTITPTDNVPNDDPNTPVDPNNPIQPGKPIDPNNPDGPKWTKDLIDKLRDARQETVTRTITYKYSTEATDLKADDAAKAGTDVKENVTVTNKVEFKRPVTIDPKTLEFTYGDWVATNNDTILEGNATVPVVPGYVATGDVEKSKTDVTDVKATDKDITDKVVYKALGKFVPVVPEGFTPPTIENPQYPNNNEDPSKPGDPTTTTTIPYVPGTTPVGPDGQPLKPKVEGDPKQGYVPPAPTTPTGDTTIVYVKDGSQVAVTHFIEVNSATDKTEKGAVAQSIVDTGDTGKAFTKGQSVTDTINALKAKGYTVVENGYPENGTFDSDVTTNQEYKVLVTVTPIPVTPDDVTPTPDTPIDPNNPTGPKWTPELIKELEDGRKEEVKRTINYIYSDGTPVPAEKLTDVADKKEKTLTFKRSATINPVTGKITFGNWTPEKQSFEAVTSPAIDNYTPNKASVEAKEVTPTADDITETVIYSTSKVPVNPVTPDGNVDPNTPVPNDPKGRTYKELGLVEEVTRTVHYVYEDGTKAADDKVQTITFTRTADIDPVTGALSNIGTWTVKANENTTFEPETTDPIAGYIASAAKSTEVTGVQATDKDTEETIIYRKLGSYVPVVPAGVTPPADFDKTPKPYPNATPEDPTRPGTPTTPTTTIPEIPGTTPVGPDGTPLTKNPNGGYDLPPVPKDPTQNTTITYVKDGSQVAVTHFIEVNSATDKTEKGAVAQSIVDTGDTGKAFTKGQSVTDTINALKAKGYTVVENGYPENGTFDADATTNQEYKVLVTVTPIPVTPTDVTPTPDTPIDPNNPTGPKWTPELIKELEDGRTEEVKRTIKYIYSDGTAVEDSNLTSVADKKEKTLTFKRSATINPVTGKITFGDWSAAQTFEEVTSPTIDNAIVDRASVPAKEVTATADDINELVVYKKLGSYVPVVPDGVTVPPGTDTTAKVYPKNPNDPTKPGTPTTTIPEIPGTTPVGPNGKPLTKNPNGGYDLPPVPEDPTQNTTITYVKDGSQVAVTHFIEVNSATDKTEKGAVAQSIVDTGDTGKAFTKGQSVTDTINALKAKGYTVVENGYPENGTFDSDVTTNQEYKVLVTVTPIPVTPDDVTPTPDTPIDPNNPTGPKWTPELIKELEDGRKEEVKRTINYIYSDGTPVPAEKLTNVADKKESTLTFKRSATINPVTGKITFGNWTPEKQSFEAVTSPSIDNYTPNKASVEAKEVTPTADDITETVIYSTSKVTVDPNAPKDPSTPNVTPKPNDVVPNDPKGRTYKELGLIEEVTRTVHYVYEDGTKAADDKVQTITFTRTAEIDTVTGAISNFGTWTLKDENNTFEPETTEAKAGYVASAAKSTEVTGVQATDKDTEETIIYRKLGSYVPVVPAGVTPPANFDKTPKPYPNATPEDPTRPGTPTTPTTTIPEIPGTTPVGPDGTPLTKNPNGGYDLPPVPTDPTQNTTITYVKDGSQVAVVHFVDEKGRAVNESVVETGDTGNTISKTNVDSVKAKLEAKGYVVVEPTDALYTTDKEGFYKEETRTFDAVSDKSTGTAGEKVPSQQYYVIVKAKEIPADPTKPGTTPGTDTPTGPTTPENGTPTPGTNTPAKPGDKIPGDPLNRTYGDLGLVEEVTRTINYVKNDGSKAADPVKETLTFTRKAKINAVTGEVTYLAADGVTPVASKDDAPWTAVNGTEFKAVKSPTGAEKPELANYTPTKAEVEAKTGVTATDEDIVETVVYNPTTETVDPKDPNFDPEKPLNPNNPNGLKYKDLKLTEEVARTITYTYADDVADTTKRGTVAAPEFKTTVSFTRTATINKATGEVTYSDWTAKDNDTTLEKDTKDLPLIPGYVATGDLEAIKKDVENVNATDKDIEDKVVYKDLGKYVPVVPEGTTPPTIENPKYPNHPTDPTKPGEPTETKIPPVDGLTPLDPSTGKPLEPKDPNDLSKGYKPPVPQDPTKDTNIVYVKDGSQVTVVHFVDEDGNAVHTSFVEAGDAGAKFTKAGEVTKVVDELKKQGYVVVPNKAGQAEYPGEAGVFDSVDDKGKDGVSQVYYVTVAKTIPVTPTTPQNPNEEPKNPNPGDPIDPNNPTGPKWTKDALDKLNNIKSVTRTITYIKDGTEEEVSTTEAPKVTNKVSFTRTVVVNPKDGSVVGYDTTGDGIADVAATDTTSGWKATGTAKFAEKTSPVVKGYVVKPNQDTQGDLVEADGSKVKASTTDLTVDSPNQDLKVRYVPVGTWTPKVPDGETPIDPIPYPNDPKDPGKVVDPNDPTTPNDPNKPSVPVIPHIPGTTPKDPNGNPLKPVDPKDPSKGYVPPTPKTPTENTEIKYEKDTQKAVTKFKDPSGNPIPGVNNIEETGKSGEPLTKETGVTTEIAKLIAKGYDLVSNNYGKDNNGNFDKDSGKDQEYTVVLTTHIQDVPPFDSTNPNDPNTPKPGQPIDPENPTGPKWTEELIKSLETTKHVNRTISYVKEDGNKVEYTDKAGNKSTADVTDKVTFTRPAKINVVTGTIEYGKWTPVNNDTTFDKVTSPVVPGYVLKDPAQKVVESKDVTETTPDETIKVVYVPVGKLVPKVPDGVTPPTPTPYDNDPQDPGKVVPPSPTKPQDPQDPNSPKVPVIPHIPGTTPKVPQDPTKPVDPNTNPLVPLKPVDPKDPSKGYEVPPVPTNPGTDTPIVYENDKQKAITNFVDNNGKVVSDPVVDQGDSGSKFTKSGEVESKIKELLKKGYVVTSNDYPSADTDRVFDNDKDKDQIFNVKVTPLIVPTDPNSPDKPQVPTDPTKPVGPNNPLKPVTPSNPEPGKPVFPEDPNSPVWPPTVKDMVTETTATRTITYVDQNGNPVAATHTETIKFKRTAKVNLVTGDITYGDWTVVGDDTILNGNKLPKVDGYIARGGDIKESQEDIKAEAGKNITQTVVYAKLGSWIPRLPEGQTNVPPTPYPNDPTDPTKPGTDKPKVPYVPGFIPVDPNGNPLKPVDPNDPTKGYEVPDIPADPTQDTPIKYIPVPTPNNGGGNNGGGGGNTPTPQPQPNPTPQPEPSPAPVPVAPEQPVAPVTPEQPAEPATPQYMDGQRELPNTGTEANSSLAALGLLGALSGFGLIARKKRKDEE